VAIVEVDFFDINVAAEVDLNIVTFLCCVPTVSLHKISRLRFELARVDGRSRQRLGVTYVIRIRAVRGHGLLFCDFYTICIEYLNICDSKCRIVSYNPNVAGTKVSSLNLLVSYECG